MKGKYGSVGAVTLEKAKLDISKKESKFSAEVFFFLPFFFFEFWEALVYSSFGC